MFSQDKCTITALLRWLESQSIPRTRTIEAALERGEKISDYDLDFFIKTITDTRYMVLVAERNKEYQELVGRLSSLYRSIVSQAVTNERQTA